MSVVLLEDFLRLLQSAVIVKCWQFRNCCSPL